LQAIREISNLINRQKTDGNLDFWHLLDFWQNLDFWHLLAGEQARMHRHYSHKPETRLTHVAGSFVAENFFKEETTINIS